MAKVIFELGSTVNVRSRFRDAVTKEPADPTLVTFTLKTPAGMVSLFEYGEDVELERLDTGVYQYTLPLEEEGTYRFYFIGETSTGAVRTSGLVDSVSNVDF